MVHTDTRPVPGITVRRFDGINRTDVFVGGWRVGIYKTERGVQNAVTRFTAQGAECAARVAEADAEYLSSVECADCGKTREDVKTCDRCGTADCDVTMDGCSYGTGLDLCTDCQPSHLGCPECNPDRDR